MGMKLGRIDNVGGDTHHATTDSSGASGVCSLRGCTLREPVIHFFVVCFLFDAPSERLGPFLQSKRQTMRVVNHEFRVSFLTELFYGIKMLKINIFATDSQISSQINHFK